MLLSTLVRVEFSLFCERCGKKLRDPGPVTFGLPIITVQPCENCMNDVRTACENDVRTICEKNARSSLDLHPKSRSRS